MKLLLGAIILNLALLFGSHIAPRASAFTTYCTPSALPIRYEISTAGLPQGHSAMELKAIADFTGSRWAALPDSSVVFADDGLTSNTAYFILDGHWRWNGDGHSVIQFADFVALGIPNNIVAQTGCWNGYPEDIMINSRYAYDWKSSDGVKRGQLSLDAVLLKEMGRLIGLGTTNQLQYCPGSAMCPTLPTGTQTSISPDDAAGAASLYP